MLAFYCWVAGAVVPVWFGLFLSCFFAAGLNGLVVRGGSEFGKRGSFCFVLISLGFFCFNYFLLWKC